MQTVSNRRKSDGRGFWSDLGAYCLSPPTYLAVIFVTLAVALSGPFGTYLTQTFIERLFFWGALLSIAVPFGFASKLIVFRFWSGFSGLAHGLAASTIFAILYTPVIWSLSRLILNGQARDTIPFWSMGIGFWVIGICVALARLLLDMDPLRPREQEEEAPAQPRLARRIALSPGARIIRVTAEGHFVDVHTDDGDIQRLRMRFSDAVDEMEGVSGYCVHRSHWVAAEAISEAEREAGRDFVRLQDGSRVPVGRKYKPALVEEGVI